jgi:3-dehydroquinate synthase
LEKILLKTPGSVSAIMIGARWEAVVKLLPPGGVVIITDNNIQDIYGSRFPDFPVMVIKPGEESKQLKTIGLLTRELLRTGMDRSGFLLAIGGGVVCDITGFLASVYLRGIRCGYISTSLLSQVDASTGGKNGVNLGVVKNVIGTFLQPEFVICDTIMLHTLPADEYLSGLAELIKTGLIGDKTIIEILEKNYQGVMNRDMQLLADLVARSVKYKASVVSLDEKEGGPRRVLNFGHTFGHAIELHESVKHGFAVASGMQLSAGYSLAKGYLDRAQHDRIINLLNMYGLLVNYNIPAGTIRKLILNDKKKSGRNLHFVFLERIGKALDIELPVEEVVEFYRKNKI